MQTINTAFERLLTELINAQIEELSDQMSRGLAPNFDEYRFLAGRIAGLRMALDHFDEVNKTINDRN